MKMSRREFIVRGSALFATLGLGGPLLFSPSGEAQVQDENKEEGGGTTESTVLVVIQLSGGNDGINTLIPYGQGVYYDSRSTLALKESEVLHLDGKSGLHPSLQGLHRMYEAGKLAVVQGVGYPNPDRSHFRSMDIWQTAEPDKFIKEGWLGRYVESSLGGNRNPLKAIQIGNIANKAFESATVNAPVIQSIESYQLLLDPKAPKIEFNRLAQSFLDMYDPKRQGVHLQVACRRGAEAYESVVAIQELASAYKHKVEYPKTTIAKDLKVAAQLLAGGSGTRVFYTQLGGFDDHADEKEQHAKLLQELDEAVTAFYSDLEEQGLASKVVTLAFSEFGRRVKENGSGGTDHGTAGPVFVMGGGVKGGMYGVYPSLERLDAHGDLKHEVDFRSVYYTLVDRWLQGDAKSTLGKSYETLGFLA